MAIRSNLNVQTGDFKPGAMESIQRVMAKYAHAINETNTVGQAYAAVGHMAVSDARKVYNDHIATLNLTEHFEAAMTGVAGVAHRVSDDFRNIARNMKSFAEDLGRSVLSFVSIASITGAFWGLIGFGGGLFGLEAGAMSVAARRRDALGLGTTYGKLSAFQANMSRFGDESVLGNVASSLYDVTSRGNIGLRAAGLPSGIMSSGDAVDVTLELYKKLPDLFKDISDPGQIGPRAESLGITQNIPLASIVRYLHASPEEREQFIRQTQQDAKLMAISPAATKAWTDFTVALDRAGGRIESAFGERLADLAKPMEDMSKGVTDLMVALINLPIVTKWIGEVRDNIEWFADQLTSKEFLDAGRHFMDGLNRLLPIVKTLMDIAVALIKAGVRVFKWYESDDNTLRGLVGAAAGEGTMSAIESGFRRTWEAAHPGQHLGGSGGGGGARASTGGAARTRATSSPLTSDGGTPAPSGTLKANQQAAYSAARAEGLSDLAARSLTANMTGEALFKPGDLHWDVKHWARGIVQWDPERSEAIRAKFGKYPNELSVADQTKAAIWEMKTNPRFRETWAALTRQGATADEMLHALVWNYENPADKQRAVNDRTTFYNKLRVSDTAVSSANGSLGSLDDAGIRAHKSYAGMLAHYPDLRPKEVTVQNRTEGNVKIAASGAYSP